MAEQIGRSLARRTRLLRPALAPDAVERPRLLAALDRGLSRPLVLLSTPAGCGKTTLLCQWARSLEARGLAVLWVSLDERAGDLASVLAHVAAALKAVLPGAGAAAQALLRQPSPPPASLVGEALAEELLGLERDVVLVLDDYHAVGDPAVHDLLDALLALPPPRLRLAIATRVDPPFALARLQARGQLVELRGADLRFTPGEAQVFLGRALGAGADAATVALLEGRTEGWAAGLRLAALALEHAAGGVTAEGVAAALGGRQQGRALHFLLDDVLARQPPEVQGFLLRVSVVDRLCVPLAAALLEGEAETRRAGRAGARAAALLEAVQRANLFVSPLEEEAGRGRAPAGAGAAFPGGPPPAGPVWYRFHQLFREALQARLLEEVGGDAVGMLHARAGAWFGAAGLVDEAVVHLLAAGDVAGAAAVVERHVHPALDAEAWPALTRWLDLLPGGAIRGRPALLLARAWVAHATGRYETIPALLAAARALLDGAADPAGSASETDRGAGTEPAPDALGGELDTLHSLLRWRAEDAPGALAGARRALARLPADRRQARGLAASYLGFSLAAVEGPAAAVRELQALLAAGADPACAPDAFARRVLAALALVHAFAGALPDAAQAARVLLAASAGAGAETGRGWGHVVLGAAHYEWDEFAAAHDHFAAALAHRHDLPFLVVREATFGLTLTLRALGRRGEAEETVARFAAAQERSGGADQQALAGACRVRLALLDGEVEAAEAWLRSEPAPPPGAAPAQLVEAVPLTRALALLVSGSGGTPGRLDEAVTYADAIRGAAAAAHQTRREVQALVLSALALRATGQAEPAAAALERALVLAEPGGFRRTFLDAGPPLVPLLRAAAAGRAPPVPAAYAARLLPAADGPATAATAGSPAARGVVLAAPGPPVPGAGAERLSERETEVLACLARRLSNKEIARELHISVFTVKRHANSINGKLGAGGRRDAVRLAVATGLLPPR
jgi:LuxR family maltose regulon positive regulatory protein